MSQAHNRGRKLTEEEVTEIRREILKGATQTAVAKAHGISPKHVNHIFSMREYSHVPFPTGS